MMTSVDRALSLLRHFSVDTPEIGLSALARMSGFDKTTTLRCLNALEKNGFLEQHPESRKYRLGIAPLQLARIREESFPIQSLIQPIVQRIAEAVNETAHATLISHRQLVTVTIAEPARATRVFVDPSESLPFHATASGVAILGAMSPTALKDFDLPSDFKAFTTNTPTDFPAVEIAIQAARSEGLGRAKSTFEDDVVGTAIPLLGLNGEPIGALAVAAVASRYDAALGAQIDAALHAAATELRTQMGG